VGRRDQAATSWWLITLGLRPSTDVAPADTAGSSSGAFRRRKVFSAPWRSFQMIAVAALDLLDAVGRPGTQPCGGKGGLHHGRGPQVAPRFARALGEGGSPFPLMGEPLHCRRG
jgi:hypothetical protein